MTDFETKEPSYIEVINKKFEQTDTLSSFLKLRKEEILDYQKNLNSKIKLHFISGFSGLGKSELLRLTPAFLNKSLFFCFDCFEKACLDDVIFSIYRYFLSIKSPKIHQFVKKIFSQTRSIDERVFELLKKFPVNFVIGFDSFEKLMDEKGKIPSEVIRFLDFLLEQENTKIIIATNRVPFELVKKHPFSRNLNLKAINFEQYLSIKQLLTNKENLDDEKIFEKSLGIIKNIKNLLKALEEEEFDKLQKQAGTVDINDYINDFLISKLSYLDAEALFYLSAIRHPISRVSIDLVVPENYLPNIKKLLDEGFLYGFENNFYVKNCYKKKLEQKVSKEHQKLVHERLTELYEKEIPLKHFERHIKLSRQTLRNELSYHIKFVENKMSNEINMKASYLNTDVLLFKDKIPYSDKDKKETEAKTEEKPSSKANSSFDAQAFKYNPNAMLSKKDLVTEGKKLLHEELKDIPAMKEKAKPKLSADKISDNPPPKLYNKTLLLDENPIDKEFTRKKIVDNSNYYKFLEEAIDKESEKNYEEAVKFYVKAQENCKHKEKEIYICSKIGHCYTKLNRKQEALATLHEAFLIAKKLDNDSKIAYVLLAIAKTFHSFGDYELAEKHYNDFLDMNGLKQLPKGQMLMALLDLGDLYIDSEKYNNAIMVYDAALKQAGAYHPSLNEIYNKCAIAYDAQEQSQKAQEYYSLGASMPYTKGTYDKYYSINCLTLGNFFLEEGGDNEKGLKYLKKAYDYDHENQQFEPLMQSAGALADSYFDQKNYKESLNFYCEKLKAAKGLNKPYLLASAYLDIGDVYIRLNNFPKALLAFLASHKALGNNMSTDSKTKIERRINFIKSKLSPEEFKNIIRAKK